MAGEADLDFADERDVDPAIEWQPYHPLDPKSAMAVALRPKEKEAILASAATKRATAEQKAVASYINQSGKLFSERYPFVAGKTNRRRASWRFANGKRWRCVAAPRKSFLKLLQKPGNRTEDEPAKDDPAKNPSTSGSDTAPEPRRPNPIARPM